MVIYDGDIGPMVQRATQGLLYTLWDLGLQVGPRGAEPARLPGHGADRLRQPHVDAAGALPGGRPPPVQPLPQGPERERLPEGLRPVPGDHARRARSALPEVRRLAVHGRAQREGVRGRAPGHPHRHVAGLHQVRHPDAARARGQAADHGARAAPVRRGAHASCGACGTSSHFLSGHKNDVLGREVQPQIAKNFGYVGDDVALAVEKFMRDYYLHARVIHRVSRRLIARCRETLSGPRNVQRRLRQEALADGLFVLDGAAPRGGRGRARLPRGPPPPDEGVLALAPARRRARARRGARAGGRARPDRRGVPALDRGPRPVPVDLPQLGPGHADDCGPCTSWACSAATCRSGAR